MPSDPSSLARFVDRTTSQKSTVTGLRSPSMAVREARILSARWRGVYDAGDAAAGSAGAFSAVGAPHPTQNFAREGRECPHAAQAAGRRCPHSRQNLASDGLSWRQ
jgi:hypothetical protein